MTRHGFQGDEDRADGGVETPFAEQQAFMRRSIALSTPLLMSRVSNRLRLDFDPMSPR